MSGEELRHELPGGGSVLFTARLEGNMSSVSGEGAECGELARERLREALGVRAIVRGRQVHGAGVRRLALGADSSPGSAEADGQATAARGLGVMVLTADCLPVALGCRGAVAMLHAGWRGLAAGVLEEGVRALRELGGTEPICALIGPGAGSCCYEVGAEVHEALTGEPHAGRIDLRAVARRRLLAAGAAEVCDVPLCTICDERFFSHRREGARAGRQAGVAWLS